jgi:hypothetical protein
MTKKAKRNGQRRERKGRGRESWTTNPYLCIPDVKQQVKNMQRHPKTNEILEQSNTQKRLHCHIQMCIDNICPRCRGTHDERKSDEGKKQDRDVIGPICVDGVAEGEETYCCADDLEED